MTAVLLAVSIPPTDAETLREHGIEVHTCDRPPSLRELAAAALELRKRHPRLPLVVCGPKKLVEKLRQRYPPLVDVPLNTATAQAVLAVLSL